MGKNSVFLFLACFAVFTSGYIREGPLYELLAKDFDDFLQEFREDLRVILFYGQFFGNSRSPSSELFTFAKNFPYKEVRFAKMNAANTTNAEIIKRFSKNSNFFMVYCLAMTDKCLEYRGEINSKGMTAVFSELMEKTVVLTNSLELEKLMESKFRFSRLCVGVFEDFQGENFTFFQNFTYENAERFKFALARDEGDWSHYFRINSDSVVVVSGSGLAHGFSEKNVALATSRIGELEKFLNWTWDPFFSFITPRNFFSFNTTEVPLFVLYLDIERFSPFIEKIVSSFAEVFKDKIVALYELKKIQLGIADVFEFGNELARVNLDSNDMMIVAYFKGKAYYLEKERFFEEGVFFKDGLVEFASSFELGTLSPHVKSEPVPKKIYEKTIRVLVASTLNEFIENYDTIHVLLVFNSRFKDDYKKALECFEALSEKYEKNYFVDFAKISGLHNSLPSNFGEKSDNRVYLVNKSRVIQYSGKWDVERISGAIDTQLQKKKTDL